MPAGGIALLLILVYNRTIQATFTLKVETMPTAAEFIAQHANLPIVSEIELFENFSLDMTQHRILKWDDNGRVVETTAMQRQAGQKESERQLWHMSKLSPERANAMRETERLARLAELTAAYQADSGFELEVDPMTFATGLAKAYRNHTGETPTFLLDDDGTL